MKQNKNQKTKEEFQVYTAYCFLSSKNDRCSYKEAMKDEKWAEPINKELESHDKLQTWNAAKSVEICKIN